MRLWGRPTFRREGGVDNLLCALHKGQRFVFARLCNDLLPDRQSAYRAFRSTETVIARVLSDTVGGGSKGELPPSEISAPTPVAPKKFKIMPPLAKKNYKRLHTR